MARLPAALEELLSESESTPTLGAFQLVKQLGKGGFAPVWLAKEVYGDTELRSVAVKLFAMDAGGRVSLGGSNSSAVSSSTSRQQEAVIEEARALIRVEHPNVVRFHAIATNPQGTVMGLVMEHLHGEPLNQTLEKKERLPLRQVLAVGSAVASALAAAHHVGVIHRDVKPHNVIDSAGIYKLIDFGIASAGQHSAPGGWAPKPVKRESAEKRPAVVVCDDLPLEALNTKMTLHTRMENAGSASGSGGSGLMLSAPGTTGYMDPASLAEPPTPASDLYSLGALLYECACGSLPAVEAARQAGKGGMLGEVLDGKQAPPSLLTVDGKLPPALTNLIDTLLDPNPKKRPASAEAVAWELERIRLDIAGSSRELPPEDVGPFRGLGRFEQADRDVYFGRSVEVAAGLETLRVRGLLALVGPSGSGKSSLVRAGIVPAVLDGQLASWPKQWDAVVATPGTDPRRHVLAALEEKVPDLPDHSPDAVLAKLAERAQRENRGTLLVVDQLEELVTLGDEPANASRQFVAALLALIGSAVVPGVRCIAAARRDLLDPLLALGELGRAMTRGTLLVAAMSEATWSDVIDHALGAYGYGFEDEGLRSELLEQLRGTVSAMPLVQFALTELWARRDSERKVIPRQALAEIGGIAGALEAHAEAKRSELVSQDESLKATLYSVLMALTTAQGTRVALPVERLRELDEPRKVDRVVELFERYRLLVREREGITIAHEALLSQWKRLRRWLAEAQSDRLLAEEVERDAEAWQTQQASERLWRGRRLLVADELQTRGRVPLSSAAVAFVDASRSAARRTKVIGVGVAAAVVALGAVGGVKYVSDVNQQRARAEAALGQAKANEAKAVANEAKAKAESARAEKATTVAKGFEAEATRQKEKFEKDLVALEGRIEGASLKQLAELKAEVRRKKGLKEEPVVSSPRITGVPADDTNVSAIGLPP